MGKIFSKPSFDNHNLSNARDENDDQAEHVQSQLPLLNQYSAVARPETSRSTIQRGRGKLRQLLRLRRNDARDRSVDDAPLTNTTTSSPINSSTVPQSFPADTPEVAARSSRPSSLLTVNSELERLLPLITWPQAAENPVRAQRRTASTIPASAPSGAAVMHDAVPDFSQYRRPVSIDFNIAESLRTIRPSVTALLNLNETVLHGEVGPALAQDLAKEFGLDTRLQHRFVERVFDGKRHTFVFSYAPERKQIEQVTPVKFDAAPANSFEIAKLVTIGDKSLELFVRRDGASGKLADVHSPISLEEAFGNSADALTAQVGAAAHRFRMACKAQAHTPYRSRHRYAVATLAYKGEAAISPESTLQRSSEWNMYRSTAAAKLLEEPYIYLHSLRRNGRLSRELAARKAPKYQSGSDQSGSAIPGVGHIYTPKDKHNMATNQAWMLGAAHNKLPAVLTTNLERSLLRRGRPPADRPHAWSALVREVTGLLQNGHYRADRDATGKIILVPTDKAGTATLKDLYVPPDLPAQEIGEILNANNIPVTADAADRPAVASRFSEGKWWRDLLLDDLWNPLIVEEKNVFPSMEICIYSGVEVPGALFSRVLYLKRNHPDASIRSRAGDLLMRMMDGVKDDDSAMECIQTLGGALAHFPFAESELAARLYLLATGLKKGEKCDKALISLTRNILNVDNEKYSAASGNFTLFSEILDRIDDDEKVSLVLGALSNELPWFDERGLGTDLITFIHTRIAALAETELRSSVSRFLMEQIVELESRGNDATGSNFSLFDFAAESRVLNPRYPSLPGMEVTDAMYHRLDIDAKLCAVALEIIESDVPEDQKHQERAMRLGLAVFDRISDNDERTVALVHLGFAVRNVIEPADRRWFVTEIMKRLDLLTDARGREFVVRHVGRSLIGCEAEAGNTDPQLVLSMLEQFGIPLRSDLVGGAIEGLELEEKEEDRLKRFELAAELLWLVQKEEGKGPANALLELTRSLNHVESEDPVNLVLDFRQNEEHFGMDVLRQLLARLSHHPDKPGGKEIVDAVVDCIGEHERFNAQDRADLTYRLATTLSAINFWSHPDAMAMLEASSSVPNIFTIIPEMADAEEAMHLLGMLRSGDGLSWESLIDIGKNLKRFGTQERYAALNCLCQAFDDEESIGGADAAESIVQALRNVMDALEFMADDERSLTSIAKILHAARDFLPFALQGENEAQRDHRQMLIDLIDYLPDLIAQAPDTNYAKTLIKLATSLPEALRADLHAYSRYLVASGLIGVLQVRTIAVDPGDYLEILEQVRPILNGMRNDQRLPSVVNRLLEGRNKMTLEQDSDAARIELLETIADVGADALDVDVGELSLGDRFDALFAWIGNISQSGESADTSDEGAAASRSHSHNGG